jgi:hypothetical protein
MKKMNERIKKNERKSSLLFDAVDMLQYVCNSYVFYILASHSKATNNTQHKRKIIYMKVC